MCHTAGIAIYNIISSKITVTDSTNKTVTEGSKNVDINCPYSSASGIGPIWKINDSLYDSLSLPPLIVPTQDSGLTIERVEMDLNGTTFQCFELNGYGLNVSAGIITSLTVLRNSKENIH